MARLRGFLNGGSSEPLLGGDIGDDLRIAGGVEDGAVQFQFTAKLEGVAQVAVVGQCHFALLVVHFDGLAVARLVPPVVP